jgi:hypothetical protein
MQEWLVLVDESGDLGKYGTKYFIIAALQIREEKPLGRIIKRARQRKLKKKMSELSELKAVNSTEALRRFILGRIASLDCNIYLLAVDKEKIAPQLLAVQNKLYNWLCRLLCQQISGEKIRLVIDKKYNNRLLRKDFNDYLERELLKHGIAASIEHLESHSYPPLQAVDFIAWAANRKFSSGDDSYYKIIQSKVSNLGEEKLWE